MERKSTSPKRVRQFLGQYAFLSNFYTAPIWWHGVRYPSLEHAYQAMKTTDPKQRQWVAAASKPHIAKRRGREVTRRPGWNRMRIAVMSALLHSKFSKSEELRTLLLNTGDAELQEGNTWGDEFWGVDLETGKGKNWLGVLLMLERARQVHLLSLTPVHLVDHRVTDFLI